MSFLLSVVVAPECGSKPLEVRVTKDANGVSMDAVDKAGEVIASITLDYFNNRLALLIYPVVDGMVGEPQIIPLLDDVTAALREKHDSAQDTRRQALSGQGNRGDAAASQERSAP